MLPRSSVAPLCMRSVSGEMRTSSEKDLMPRDLGNGPRDRHAMNGDRRCEGAWRFWGSCSIHASRP